MKTARCINDHYILLIGLGMCNGCLGNVHWALLITHGKDFYALLLTIHLQLCDRCGSVYITGYQKRSLTLGLDLTCKLGCGGGLTSTLETCHHKHGKVIARLDRKFCSLASHKINQLFIYNLDDHLAWIQSVHNVLSNRTFLYRFGELLHHSEVNVRLKECHLNLLKSDLNILFGQAALASKLLEYILKFICQAFKCHEL
ncbi:putative uncharacterized protein PY07686 [Ruminococcus sp. CAG:60]|nr:putative uncharacterized protein PY07686 [Ruminococcus sp. CAG:60]